MFQGSLVALVTPMQENGEVDYSALERLVEFHVKEQTDGIVSVGTTGESPTVNFDEHIEIIKKTIGFANKRLPVIAGAGANSTSEAIALTQAAEKLGADAVLSVVPYYNKPTQEGLYQHFKIIAEKSNIPIILYNVPGRTCCDLLPETVQRLSEIKNIIGIKEASGSIDKMKAIQKLCSNKFIILSGEDALTSQAILEANIQGVISVTANVAPKLMHQMCRAALNKDISAATTINQTLDELHHNLFLEANPIPVKWALYKMGMIGQNIRLPLTILSLKHQTTLERSLQKVGLIT